MVAIEEALQIRYLTNSNGDLKSFSDLMNARQSLKSFRNDGLLKEHSHGWKNFRRLTIDYEFHADTAEAMIQLAFCKIMLNKIIVLFLNSF